jgi:hypothetical protein
MKKEPVKKEARRTQRFTGFRLKIALDSLSGRQNAPYNFIFRIFSVLKSLAQITHLILHAPTYLKNFLVSKVRNLWGPG